MLDKPTGITSARAVAGIKRLLPRGTKIGHTGTLDPLASGLLVLVIGRATRLSRYATGLDKTYTATARFGAISDTLDAEGEITPLDQPFPTEGAILAALPTFTGDILQTPPMASAIKIGGERLYAMHRRGETVEREARPVTIHRFDLLDLDPETQTAAFHVHCTSGTYVRSLISDLANALGTGAYLTALRRDSVGHLHTNHAHHAESLDQTSLHNHIIPLTALVEHLPAVQVSREERSGVCNGRSIMVREVEGSFRVECEEELLAVYRGVDGEGRAEVVLCGG